jgi:methionyl-tRNA formyltransferase
MSRCVVFAYHNVGYRCLSVLLDRGMEVALVVTHEDDPGETQWFESVAALAALHGIPVITPEDPNVPEVVARMRELRPDFIFSFYYRRMLKEDLLGIPLRGALNMHGSLLPRYRGRVPVNWAIIHGETQTGASLHYMELKPDAGDLVDQQAVPILKDDTALEVFHKVACAAELVLHRSLPLLLEGRAPRIPLDLAKGSYFGGRRPEDGRIDWKEPAEKIHNLIRAVAPPYPGAFTSLGGQSLRILRSRLAPDAARHPESAPCLYYEEGACYADCPDGRRLQVLSFELAPDIVSAEQFFARFATRPQKLGDLP